MTSLNGEKIPRPPSLEKASKKNEIFSNKVELASPNAYVIWSYRWKILIDFKKPFYILSLEIKSNQVI